MQTNTTDLYRVFDLGLLLDNEDSYLRSYQTLLEQVTQKHSLTFEDIVGLAHMVYGWMPTILTLHFEKISREEITQIVNAARQRLLNAAEIELLKKFINNSLVGASKLLHFVSPQMYAIWDSKIYFFLHQKPSNQSTISNTGKHFEYLSKLDELEKHPKFKAFHAKVNEKLNYSVSAKRALELIMFVNSTPKTNNT